MLVIDLRSVIEAAQAYVMLSRVQALSQLIILVASAYHKIYASSEALKELNEMHLKALNNKCTSNVLVSLNIRSLPNNYENLITTPNILACDVICLQETWMNDCLHERFEINGFQKHFTSVGHGKGIATYFREIFSFIEDVKNDSYQMTKISSESQDIINVYKSKGATSMDFIGDFQTIFTVKKKTIVV